MLETLKEVGCGSGGYLGIRFGRIDGLLEVWVVGIWSGTCGDGVELEVERIGVGWLRLCEVRGLNV